MMKTAHRPPQVCFHCTIFIFNVDMFLISDPWQDQSSERSAGIGSSPPRPLMDEQLRMRKLGRVVINFGDGQWSPPLLGSVGSEPGPPIKVKQLVVMETGLCEHVGPTVPVVHLFISLHITSASLKPKLGQYDSRISPFSSPVPSGWSGWMREWSPQSPVLLLQNQRFLFSNAD